jgi:branched-subunit amino acid aminotransferase/4-amino-4-deoxychorismate lyase
LQLFTPPINTPVLPGVARKTVCQLAMQNSIKFTEKDLTIEDVLGADEIFLTNVIMQVMPITKVEKHMVGDSQVGPITKKLHKSFGELVKKECGKDK